MSSQLEKTWGEELEEQWEKREAEFEKREAEMEKRQAEMEKRQAEMEKRQAEMEKKLAEQLAEQLAVREARTRREDLRLLLTQRFPTLPPEVLQRIENANLDQLKQALPQILTIQSPEELVL